MTDNWTDIVGTLLGAFWQLVSGFIDIVIGVGQGTMESLWDYGAESSQNLVYILMLVIIGSMYVVYRVSRS